MMTDPNKVFFKEESCIPLNVMMDYIHDRLPNKERNHVERHALQCEFCNEAIEGLSLADEKRSIDIIESIDEVNLLEDQILYAASFDEANHVEESNAEFELAPAPMPAMPSKNKMRKAESVGGNVVLKESKEDKNIFDWRRIAASISLILLVGGGLLYYLTNNTNPTSTPVALTKEKSPEQLKV